MVEWIIFGIASVGITWFSWSSLRRPRSHGFYRHFAFESILALILLNAARWFRHPLSILQIISWLLLLSSLFLALYGFGLLRRVGKPEGQIEDTTVLVKTGVYRFIRHPLYASLLLLAWGAFFKAPSLPGICLAAVASAFLYATARVEEVENISRFGEDYTAYMRSTKRFIPFLF